MVVRGLFAAAIAAFFGTAAPSYAATFTDLTFSLLNAQAVPGTGSITFVGQLTNTGPSAASLELLRGEGVIFDPSLDPYLTSGEFYDLDPLISAPVSIAAGDSLVFDFYKVTYANLPAGAYKPFLGASLYDIDNFELSASSLPILSVAAVPEVSTWAMMIVGFGLVGGAMRRRDRKATTTVRYA